MGTATTDGDELLSAREAEALTGLRYGFLEQARRMVDFCLKHHPDDTTNADVWRARSPPWVKVGNAYRYRKADLAPFMTNRAGANRNGVCGTCRYYHHSEWERSSEYFNPERASCIWAKEHIVQPANAPPWLRGGFGARVSAKGGRGCRAYEPTLTETTNG